MSGFKASTTWDELALELILQTSLIAGLMALSFWLWPEHLLDATAGIHLRD